MTDQPAHPALVPLWNTLRKRAIELEHAPAPASLAAAAELSRLARTVRDVPTSLAQEYAAALELDAGMIATIVGAMIEAVVDGRRLSSMTVMIERALALLMRVWEREDAAAPPTHH